MLHRKVVVSLAPIYVHETALTTFKILTVGEKVDDLTHHSIATCSEL